MYYCVYEDRKSDVFLNNPVIRPAVEKEEMLERVYSDLDFEKNDNVILLTYKVVNDEPSGEYWDWYNDGIYPDDIIALLDDMIVEINGFFGKTNKSDYFKTMMTAEIIEYEESSKCIWHIIVNMKNINFDEIKNRLRKVRTGSFQALEFDSIFVNNTKFPKPYKWRWYIEPVSNMLEIISKIMNKYAQSHKRNNIGLNYGTEMNVSKKPECFSALPIWRINGHLPDSVDAQYVLTTRDKLYKEREKNMKYYDVTSLMFNKYNLLTVDELWDFN